jgi:hypothetical protein
MTPHATKDEIAAAWADGYHERDELVRKLQATISKLASRIEVLSDALTELYETATINTENTENSSKAFTKAKEILSER